MENRKVGAIIIVLSILIGGIMLSMINSIQKTNNEMGCFAQEGCQAVQAGLGFVNIGLGVVSFLLALGFYLVFFYKGEEYIMKRLEEEKNKKLSEDKFGIMLKMLDDHEKKVFYAIKQQDGITQSTLTLRTGLSKSKVSEILGGFETKNLIKRLDKGRTRSVFLTEAV